MWGEGDGAGLRVHDADGVGRLGGLICGEHNLALARYALQAQQEQVHVASYPDPLMEGRPFADRRLLSFAMALEKALSPPESEGEAEAAAEAEDTAAASK